MNLQLAARHWQLSDLASCQAVTVIVLYFGEIAVCDSYSYIWNLLPAREMLPQPDESCFPLNFWRVWPHPSTAF